MSAVTWNQTDQPHRELPTLADYVLLRLASMYIDRIDVKLPTEAAVAAFRHELNGALERYRITEQQVDLALLRMEAEFDWPVVDVPVFLRLCSPIRDFESAFREAAAYSQARLVGERRRLSHPAIYWAAERFGWFEVRNESWQGAKSRWSVALTEVLCWGEWPPFDQRALPEAGKTTCTPGAHRAAMAKARGLIAASRPDVVAATATLNLARHHLVRGRMQHK